MRELVASQHVYHYRGPEDSQAHCMLRIFRDSEDPRFHTVLLTEVPDNPGISVSNNIEQIAAQVCRQYGLVPTYTTIIDHHGRLNIFEMVQFDDGLKNPTWKLMGAVQLEEVLPPEAYREAVYKRLEALMAVAGFSV